MALIRIRRGSERFCHDGGGETLGPGSPGLIWWIWRAPQGAQDLISPSPVLTDRVFVPGSCPPVHLVRRGAGRAKETGGARSGRPGLLRVRVASRVTHWPRVRQDRTSAQAPALPSPWGGAALRAALRGSRGEDRGRDAVHLPPPQFSGCLQ